MEFFNNPLRTKITIVIFFIMPVMGLSQKNSSIKTMIAKVIDYDKDCYDENFAKKITMWPREFYYSIHHFRVVGVNGDTMNLAYIFNIKRQIVDLSINFGINKDSVYQFYLYSLNPCNCDFPLIPGCAYKKNKHDSKFIPLKESIIKIPYNKISSIIDFTPIDVELWNQIAK